MRLAVEDMGVGLHPDERRIKIATADGAAYSHAWSRSGPIDHITVGYPVGQRDGAYLVELPHETTNGAWRVWVPVELVTMAPEKE